MKFFRMFNFFQVKNQKSDFSAFFLKPISDRKKTIKSAVKHANTEQKELYKRYKQKFS